MKLRMKFFLIFSVLAVIPLLVLTEYSYAHYREVTYERMDDLSDNLFHNAVKETENTLSTISQSIQFLTFYSNDDDYSVIENMRPYAEEDAGYTSYDIYRANQRFNSVFQNIMTSYDYITGIYIFTPSNVIFSCTQSTNTINANYNPQGSAWYEKTLELDGQFYISSATDPDMFTNTVTDSVFFSLSVKDIYSHQFLGVILVSCDSDIFDLSTVNTMSA